VTSTSRRISEASADTGACAPVAGIVALDIEYAPVEERAVAGALAKAAALQGHREVGSQ
jgi:hypothetical protein